MVKNHLEYWTCVHALLLKKRQLRFHSSILWAFIEIRSLQNIFLERHFKRTCQNVCYCELWRYSWPHVNSLTRIDMYFDLALVSNKNKAQMTGTQTQAPMAGLHTSFYKVPFCNAFFWHAIGDRWLQTHNFLLDRVEGNWFKIAMKQTILASGINFSSHDVKCLGCGATPASPIASLSGKGKMRVLGSIVW